MSEIKTAEEILNIAAIDLMGRWSIKDFKEDYETLYSVIIRSIHDYHNQFKHSVGDDEIEEMVEVYMEGIHKDKHAKLVAYQKGLEDMYKKLSTPKESDAVEFYKWLQEEYCFFWNGEIENSFYSYPTKIEDAYKQFLKTKHHGLY